MLGDFYRPEAAGYPLGAREPAVLRVPTPRLEVNPAMAGDRQRQIDRPAELQEFRLRVSDQAASRACDRSANMSCSCSIPIDSRT